MRPKIKRIFREFQKHEVKFRSNEREFSRIFKRPLKEYWNEYHGFDICKFDDEIIKAPDGISCKQAVANKYGIPGLGVVTRLLS